MKPDNRFFPASSDGFPDPANVIRWYRMHKTYTDSMGNVRHWTQADLAKCLDLSEIMVRQMENKGKGLDSIVRRRDLARILGIPLGLLGLANTELDRVEQPHHSFNVRAPDDLALYQETLSMYKQAFNHSSQIIAIPSLKRWIARLVEEVQTVTALQSQLLHILYGYHRLLTDVYHDNLRDTAKAFTHLSSAHDIALRLSPIEQVSTLSRISELQLVSGNIRVAIQAIQTAMDIPIDSPEMRGQAYMIAALAHAMLQTETSLPLRLLDKAESFVKDKATYSEYRADTLIIIGQYETALGYLDIAEDMYVKSGHVRQHAYIKILQAEVAIKQCRPEYDLAASLLAEVCLANRHLHNEYQLQYVERLLRQIRSSSYGNAPIVASIGQELQKARFIDID